MCAWPRLASRASASTGRYYNSYAKYMQGFEGREHIGDHGEQLQMTSRLSRDSSIKLKWLDTRCGHHHFDREIRADSVPPQRGSLHGGGVPPFFLESKMAPGAVIPAAPGLVGGRLRWLLVQVLLGQVVPPARPQVARAADVPHRLLPRHTVTALGGQAEGQRHAHARPRGGGKGSFCLVM